MVVVRTFAYILYDQNQTDHTSSGLVRSGVTPCHTRHHFTAIDG